MGFEMDNAKYVMLPIGNEKRSMPVDMISRWKYFENLSAE